MPFFILTLLENSLFLNPDSQTATEDHSTIDGSKKLDPTPSTNRTSKQDSLEQPELRDSHHVRSSSPRRLIKQTALAESPPDEEPHHFYRNVHTDKKHSHTCGEY